MHTRNGNIYLDFFEIAAGKPLCGFVAVIPLDPISVVESAISSTLVVFEHIFDNPAVVSQSIEDMFVKHMLLIFIFVLSGCSVIQHQTEPAPQIPAVVGIPSSQLNWWIVNFDLAWPQDAEIAWHLDPLIAHKIIFPILASEKDSIHLWRIHRRAIRDATGHRFRFIFYSSSPAAARIYQLITANTTLELLNANGQVVALSFDDPNKLSKPNLADASDHSWSEVMQKTWPFFIMGVSEMWINMVDELARRHETEYQFELFQDTIDFYKQVEDALRSSWRIEGNHALLHHLNAVFGYADIAVYEQRLMRF